MIDDFKPTGSKQVQLGRILAEPAPSRDTPSEMPFRTPDEIANDSSPEPTDTKLQSGKGKRRFASLPQLNKRQWLVISIVIVIVLSLSGYFGWKLTRKAPPPPPTPTPVIVQKIVEPPKPTTTASPLTGIQVSFELAALPVTAIMIENSPDARPQSGLKDANVVFEAIAEGGITRFLTLFQEAQPEYIGPVRSVRPYYLDWAVPFDAPIAHAGGSGAALAQIRSEGIKDLDQFSISAPYQRISSRYAPHNLYTSRSGLLAAQRAKGFNTSVFLGFPRKNEAASAAPIAKSIDFAISGFLYNPHYDYDITTNSYKRSMAGKPHVDEKSGEQINPKVVIAIIATKGIDPNGVNSTYATTGSGKAFIFQDGLVTEGIWEKADRKSQIKFGDANGAPLALNNGNTWISAVGLAGSVSYKP